MYNSNIVITSEPPKYNHLREIVSKIQSNKINYSNIRLYGHTLSKPKCCMRCKNTNRINTAKEDDLLVCEISGRAHNVNDYCLSFISRYH
jgi:hypothetical protein